MKEVILFFRNDNKIVWVIQEWIFYFNRNYGIHKMFNTIFVYLKENR